MLHDMTGTETQSFQNKFYLFTINNVCYYLFPYITHSYNSFRDFLGMHLNVRLDEAYVLSLLVFASTS